MMPIEKAQAGRGDLYLTNTLGRKKERFRPLYGRNVKMFTCGPSIYRRPHLGNYRTFLFEDVLVRYLEYLGYEVQRIINFTDVEDKSLAEAKNRGETLKELTDSVADRFYKESALLRMKLPEEIPRSSTVVAEAVDLIERLIRKGYAYRHGQDVFYDPLKFEGFGKLFGLDMSRWPSKRHRFRRDTYPGRRWNLGDFILWHGAVPGDTGAQWETRIGRGRPAWNVQDPAAIVKHLGSRVDICCGGSDNLYRHHDYTLAIMESASGHEFCRTWLHGEHLLVEGAKMSKSRGNIVYTEQLLDQGYSSGQLRFFLIYGHYRKQRNLTGRFLDRAIRKLDHFRAMVSAIMKPDSGPERATPASKRLVKGLIETFETRMSDDLDVKGAFDGMTEIITKLAALKTDGRLSRVDVKQVDEALSKVDCVLQVLTPRSDGGAG
jgi:cysteinyl-tRNA synthetase